MHSRVDSIARNMKFSLISQVLLVAANLLLRRVFVSVLGEEYLGLNGLFSDILSMLSLAELGFGTSIVYSLYEPLAKGDTEKIKSLMALYRKAYTAVGALILAAGICLTPYLSFFVKEMPQDIAHIELIYILNVVNSGVSYFFIYKASLLFADQKKYVEMVINTAVKLLASAAEVFLLLKTGNYLLYLTAVIAATFIQNAVISVRVNEMYPYLREKNIRPLEKKDTGIIKRNVGAMFFHKVGSVAVFSTDNLLMAKMVSISAVGLYSNYVLVRRVLETVINMIYTSLAASVGNLNVCETDEKKYDAFNNINFFSAWLFGFIGICLMCLYNPFISLWLGEKYLLPFHTVAIIVINFYFYCMRVPVGRTKEAMGLFWNDRYKPIAEVIINIGASVLLARSFGIDGILWGTLISTVLVPFWVEPFVLYRHGLKKTPLLYFGRYAWYSLVTILCGFLTYRLCGLCGDGLLGFCAKMVICAAVPNAVYLAVYRKTREFQYIWDIVKRLYRKVLHRDRRQL